MNFFNLFRPKWKNSDPDVRLKAVEKLTDPQILAEIVRTEKYYKVRLLAASKLDDQPTITEMANDHNWQIRQAAIQKMTDQKLLAKIAREDKWEAVQDAAVERLDDQQLLAEIAVVHQHYKVRESASSKMKDKNLIADVALELAMTSGDTDVCNRALEKLTDQERLARVVRGATNKAARLRAVDELTDQAVLAEIVRTEKSAEIRKSVVYKLQDRELLAQIARSDDDGSVRVAAALKSKDHKLLAEIAQSHSEPQVRQSALNNLTATEAQKFHQEIIGKIAREDVDPGVRIIAVDKLIDQNLLAQIARTDKEHQVRGCARTQLSRIVLRWPKDLLLNTLSDQSKDSELRIEAAKVLANWKDIANKKDTDRSFCAIKSLQLFGDRSAVEVLLALLSANDSEVEQAVINTMRSMGESAVERLLGLVKEKSADRLLRKQAAKALGDLKERRAVKPLTDALKDHLAAQKGGAGSYVKSALEEIGEEAIEALERIGDPQAIEVLEQAVYEGGRALQVTAKRALKALEMLAPLRKQRVIEKGFCVACQKPLRPFSIASGMWSGTLSDQRSMPRIEPDNGFECDSCGHTICPICSGRKASELGIRAFVCTYCGYSPLATIYRT